MKAPKIALFGAFTFMNIPPILFRDPDFITLREEVGIGAMHALTAIGTMMQSKKTNRLRITSPKQLLLICDLSGEVDAGLLWESLIGVWLIHEGENEYSMPLFDENNGTMLSNWNNGRKLKEDTAERKAIQANSAQVNSSQVSSNQDNSSQLNSVAPRKGVGNALGNASSEATRSAKISQVNW